jgi:succinylarginine dihydrolase
MTAGEVNFDGLVGPTHNYAGLASGNIASQRNKAKGIQSPRGRAAGSGENEIPVRPGRPTGGAAAAAAPGRGRAAAARFQPAATRKVLRRLKQAPRFWPHAPAPRRCGRPTRRRFRRRPTRSTGGCISRRPILLSQLHRSLEAPTTARVLKRIFSDESLFAHHPPLPPRGRWPTKGPPTTCVLPRLGGLAGVEVFVFGRRDLKRSAQRRGGFRRDRAWTRRRPSPAVTVCAASTIFLQQNPMAIDAGAFHNDVVAVANLNVLLYHTHAWVGAAAAVARMRAGLRSLGTDLVLLR